MLLSTVPVLLTSCLANVLLWLLFLLLALLVLLLALLWSKLLES